VSVDPFRRTRLLLALGPLAGTLGALLGVAVNSSLGDLSFGDLCGLSLMFYTVAAFITLFVGAHGWSRERPFHALKACAALAVALFFPGLLMAELIKASGC
jgi:hypothetical protein